MSQLEKMDGMGNVLRLLLLFVVRQEEDSSLFVLGTRSRIKFGLTANGCSKKARFCHSDKVPGRNLNASAS